MRRRTSAILTALVVALTMLAPAPVGAAKDKVKKPKLPKPTVTAASDVAVDKIDTKLLTEIETAGTGKSLQFVARIAAGTDLSPYTDSWFARPFVDPLGTTVASGFARGGELIKMAADPGVIKLQRAESLVEPPAPADPDVAAAANLNVQVQIGSDAPSPGPAPEGWYSTGSAIHGSQEAWAKGYTGAGVRYMSNDSGADYCHPDLAGTWAYIDDGGPYHGLPQMFDSISAYYAALDFYLGLGFIPAGLADYADTSATTTGPTFSFAPIGAAGPHTYMVSGTSLSGTYHYGSHPDKALAEAAPFIAPVGEERAAVLVVDETVAGVYDTVYVDLNYDFDFTNDSPARLTRDFTGQETACWDYDLDGLNDVSGGLVYFISDGATAVPTLDWFWGIPGAAYGPGDLVAFHVQDFTEGGGTHGQGTTSTATGLGVVAGSVFAGPAGPPQAGGAGLVVGPGKDVASTQNGDFYLSPFIEDGFIFATLGTDGVPGTGDDVQIVSNSWGSSGIDNDGFDYESRLIDAINRSFNPTTAMLFSTGNGAAGYGTVAPPSPAAGIGVGASTLYGTIGLFESIGSADQIVGGDPMSWSNRGPGVRNIAGADVVATGAFGTGDLSLNEVLWGAVATANFGGTSMAAPVAAGNLALMYQAWRDRTGSWPTFEEARELLMGTARDTDHDVWTQGAGLVNADTGTDVAGGHAGVFASPAEWSVGDYRGTEYTGFAHVIEPGESDTQTFTLINPSGGDEKVKIETTTLKLKKTKDYSFTSLDQSLDHGDFTTPDYAFRIDKDVPKNTDVLQVRVTKPYEQFDPDEDLFEPFSNWRVHLQNWTDLNGDGNFWDDANGNGKVDIGEMDADEHIRFTYGYNAGPTQQARMSNPRDRIDDGLLLTLRHRDSTPAVPTTDLTIEASMFKKTKWSWVKTDKKVTVPAGGSATFDAKIKVPKNTPYGMYEGAIEVSVGSDVVIIPVTVAVAAEGTSFAFGSEKLAKGKNVKDKTPKAMYDNERVFGYTDYTWRAESGDWRFFWTDVDGADLPGFGTSFLVTDTQWQDGGTDIDTVVLGPTPDCFSNGVGCGFPFGGFPGDPATYGPYTLEQVGRSANTYIGSGRWAPQTSSGGPREMVSAPAQDGLHGILLHQVRVGGDLLNEAFTGSVGLVNLDPSSVAATGDGSASVTISSEIPLDAFAADGFGLGAPVTTTETAFQDDPNDPGSASVKVPVTMDHAGRARISTALGSDDLDLFLVYDADGSGTFTNSEIIAQSTTPTSNEFIEVAFPADGDYEVWVQGWSVAAPVAFELTIDIVQGFDVTVTATPAAVAAGGSGVITFEWDTTGKAPGVYGGLVLFGPASAPGLFTVPLEITVP